MATVGETVSGNVHAEYTSNLEEVGVLMVSRPCSLVGVLAMAGTTGSQAGTLLQFSDGSGGDVKFQYEVTAMAFPGLGWSSLNIPDGGIRFDVGLFVTGIENQPVEFVTVIYQ